jgi:hypothetical protein
MNLSFDDFPDGIPDMGEIVFPYSKAEPLRFLVQAALKGKLYQRYSDSIDGAIWWAKAAKKQIDATVRIVDRMDGSILEPERWEP